MQFVRRARLGPRLLAHRGDRIGIQPTEIARTLGIAEAAARDRLGAAFLERRVVEVRIRPRAEHLGRERRRAGQVARDDAHRALFQPLQQRDQSVDIHRCMQAIVQGLLDQRMIGNLALADQVFGTRHLIRKHRRKQVFGLHALQLRWHLATTLEPRQSERAGRVPAPAHAEHRCIEQGLDQHVAHRCGMQIAGDVLEWETVAGRQRQHDRVLGGCRLQFEVELAAEALAQGKTPGAIDAAAERRMDDQLGAAGFVEEALHREFALGRQHAQSGLRGAEVVDDLACGGFADADLLDQPCLCFCRSGVGATTFRSRAMHRRGCAARARRITETVRDFLAQTRHRKRKLIAASRRLAEPERDRRWRALRVLHSHAAAFDAQDAVRLVAELEDIAGDAFDREVLVDATDHRRLWFEHDFVIGGVRDRAARGDRGQTRAATRTQDAVNRVAMQIRAARSAPCREAIGEHAHNRGELLARNLRERVRTTHEVEKVIFPAFAAGDFGDDLLRKHIERRALDVQGIELPAAHRIE